MFKTILAVDELTTALEARTPEQEEKRKEFLESRIARRWNFNRNSNGQASTQLSRFKENFTKIQNRISKKKFNKEKFASYKSDIRAVSAKLLTEELEQIKHLAIVFEQIASQPPSSEKTNLLKFKSDMIKILKKNAPTYSYNSYKVYSIFMIDKGLVKSGASLKELGYDESFIEKTQQALDDFESLIKSMKEHEDLIHKLGKEIVSVLMGPKAKEYLHARRGYELVCTVYTSILTNAIPQALAMAVSIAGKISSSYE